MTGVSAVAAAATGVALVFRFLLPGSGRLSTGKVTPFARLACLALRARLLLIVGPVS
jgi:hypothetical protein